MEAGAAGITAGYILERYGIDYEILEASSIYGGRVKRLDDFADFPIDLGAEWIHTKPSILAKIISNTNVNAQVESSIILRKPSMLGKNNQLKKRDFFGEFYSEYKFKNDHLVWFLRKSPHTRNRKIRFVSILKLNQ